MMAIGWVALTLALIRWEYAALVVAPGVLIGSTLMLARTGRVTGLRAAVCVVAAYPWSIIGTLALAFGSAWLTSGQRPGSTGQPQPGRWVQLCEEVAVLLLLGWPLVFLVGIILVAADIISTLDESPPDRPARVGWLFLGPILLWLGAGFVLALDPGGAVSWLLGDPVD